MTTIPCTAEALRPTRAASYCGHRPPVRGALLLVAGNQDSVIPIAHTLAAHDVLPDSRLEIFDDAGHFPHIDQPQRFVHLLHDFLIATAPAEVDAQSIRRQLLDR